MKQFVLMNLTGELFIGTKVTFFDLPQYPEDPDGWLLENEGFAEYAVFVDSGTVADNFEILGEL